MAARVGPWRHDWSAICAWALAALLTYTSLHKALNPQPTINELAIVLGMAPSATVYLVSAVVAAECVIAFGLLTPRARALASRGLIALLLVASLYMLARWRTIGDAPCACGLPEFMGGQSTTLALIRNLALAVLAWRVGVHCRNGKGASDES